MKRVIFLLSISFFLLSSVTSAQLMDSPSPIHGINLQHTGQSNYSSDTNGTVEWTYNAGADIKTSVAIDNNGIIYFGSNDCYLHAVYPNGTLKWKYDLVNGYIRASPTIDNNGIIYIGSTSGLFVAVYPNGTLKWEHNFGLSYNIESPAAIDINGTIYIIEYDTYPTDSDLHAFYPNGTIKWSYSLDQISDASPTIDYDENIYISGYHGNLTALNQDGSFKWTFETGEYIYDSVSIATDGTIYVPASDNDLYAVYPNGSQKWNYTVGNEIYSYPAIATDGTIYVSCRDDYLYAINPDGTFKWKCYIGYWVYSSPTIDLNGDIYVSSYENFSFVDSNGTKIWNFFLSGEWFKTASIAEDGTVYVGSDDNNLYAFKTPTLPSSISILTSITQNSVPLTSTLITGDDSTGGFVSGNGEITLEPNERDNKTFSLEVTDSALIDGFELAITADNTNVTTLVININNLGADRTYNIYLDDQFLEKIGEVAAYQYNMTTFSTHTLKVEYDISDEDANGGGGSGPITPPDEELIEIGELILTKDEFDLLTIDQIEALNVSQDTKDKLIEIKSINVNWWLFILVISLTGFVVEGSHKKGHESIIIISFIGVVISAYKLGYF